MTSRIDLETLKRAVSLSVVVQHYCGAPVKSNARGAWWRCPFHVEDSPSFLVGGRADHAQEYHCFGCGAHGDALEFIKAQERLGDNPRDFITAVKKLAALAGTTLPTTDHAPVARAAQTFAGPSSSTWQEAARAFVAQSQDALWGSLGAGCLRYLREQRGLTDETLKAWGLGWHTATRKDPQAAWGMPDREKPVWLPQGLVIPGAVDGVLWYVKIRPSKEVRRYFEPKYYQLPAPDGERGCLLGVDRWQAGLPAVLLEGEMDTLTVWQEARDLVNVATLGGAAKGRAGHKLNFGRWLWHLAAAPRLFVGYDPDTAGQQARDTFGAASARFEPLNVPFGADVNDYHTHGGDVAAWLRSVLDVPAPRLSPAVDARYPLTLIFPDQPGLPVIHNQWRRLDDGSIEMTFMDAEELALIVEVARAIRQYQGGAQ